MLVLSLTSCGIVVISFDNMVKQKKINKFAEKNGIHSNELFYMEKSFIDTYIKGMAKTGDMVIDSLSLYTQPFQFIYFDKLGRQISYNSNCLQPIKFPFTMDWNHQGLYDTFPPKDITESKPPQDLCKDSLLCYIHPISKYYDIAKDTTQYDYYVFILGCVEEMKGQSKEMIRIVNSNIALDSSDAKIKRYFVVTDTFLGYDIEQ